MKPVFFAAVACCLFVPFLGVSLAHPDDPPTKNEKKEAAKPGFTISKETTCLLQPVGPDGYIDYLQALNELCSKGVTPENNACIPLLRLLGPAQLDGSELPEEFYRRLGIAPLPAKGDYFIGWDQFFEKEQTNDTARRANDFLFERITRLPWSAAEFPKAAQWIKANEKVAIEAIQASRYPRFYVPYVLPKNTKPEERSSMNVVLPSMMKRNRDLGNLLRARAMLHLHDNQFDTAIKDLIACHRLARLIGQGGWLIGWLWAVPLDRYAADSDLTLLADQRISVDVLARLEKEIHALPMFPSYIELIDKFERLSYLDNLFFVERYGMKHLAKVGGVDPGWGAEIQDKFFYRGLPWDPALKESNAWYDRYVNILKITNRNQRDQEFKQLQQDIVRIRLQFVTNKGQLTAKWLKLESRAGLLADMFRAFYFPSLVTGEVSADLQIQSERNLRVALALARYWQEHHKYPEKLVELMPKYLAAIPQDIFTGKDLVYRKIDQGYLLYSVGPNGKDDGGRTRDDDPACDDIVIHMPLPELKVQGK